ncbi:unnamed protein product [Penicillium salamii]|uniref:Zn(2)-C6 fungal-type domain-containing protein n=1 Tax=Penicillium salamii TaxID=1612424 RepID=A0A9W4NHH3_9EURO|nr:unnamed protein product [Penicillium salamii]CAG8066235.1 unnamed protein product [Penicillium salamii]CAG8073479.1 unnamed protein product [Penicillium salamii]CAG8173230.1 unnamed protein product [Penicillium salamii]CAG8227298.1 unnamed protein product [Penicillium salamii]
MDTGSPNNALTGARETDSPSKQLTPFSCVVCHKRKVKCDRQEPCSNCAKANVECVYRAPPPRRKRGLEANGSVSQERAKSVRRDAIPARGSSIVPQRPPTREERRDPRESGSGRMIMKDGNSIYLDNNLWTSVSNELPNAADVLGDVSDTGTENPAQDMDDEYTILSPTTAKKSLAELHPSPLHIFKLWQAFLENVNPLTKVIHVPTVQQQILEAMSDLPKASKELETLMFAIYCIALVSMEPGDVERSFGESKRALLSRYKQGAQFAFKNASLLRTSSLTVLQAFMLYLLCMRSFSDPHTIWTLCGIATRIAQRIGVHRDGSNHGLSVFETEMRRRVWFQLMIIDVTSAQSCGVASSLLPASIDVQPPMNANDSDLDPRMTEPACVKQGPTEMIFVLARSGLGQWLRRLSTNVSGSNTGPWANLSSSSMPLEEKDKVIDQLEEFMEKEFLRYCDKSIPLHMQTRLMVRSAVHYTRLMAHHPRQYQDQKIRLSPSEKNIIFESALKMTKYADHAQNNPVVRRFSWHTVNHMPWDAMIFMLSELRHRTNPEEKSTVWQLIGNVYSEHVLEAGDRASTPLHTAIESLIVKAWRAYIGECSLKRCAPTSCPNIVASLLANRPGLPDPQTTERAVEVERDTEPHAQPGYDFATSHYDREPENLHFMTGDSPVDWNEWDNLLNQFQSSLVDDATYLG